jgi:hypothetical protein
VGVDINNPANVLGWATTAVGGGIWGHGGVASDGTNMFVVTGNTWNTAGIWMGGEAIIRLQEGPIWSGQPTDYWAPFNWHDLDDTDSDLGGVSATVVDVPGATPSQLVLALGKDSNAYLVNRNNLGGINGPVYQANVSGINRGTSAVTYHTSQGTYIAFHNDVNQIRAYKITATSPPTIVFAWSQNQTGRGSPWVTTTDGTNNTIVWVVGTSITGDQRLHGYDGDSGAIVYAGGGANELMTGTRQWNTGIAARNRIYFAANDKVYAFKVPGTTSIGLRARGRIVGGQRRAQLSWRGATSTNVDVYRSGGLIVTTANDGSYTDQIGGSGHGSFTYQVCEAGTQTCSNDATVTF